MTEQEKILPDNVVELNVGDRKVYLVGTAHISKSSVEEVGRTIQAVMPDTVCIELCYSRYEAMCHPDTPKMGLVYALKKRKFLLYLLGGGIALFYKFLSKKFDVQPGAEMLEAIKQAEKIDAVLLPVDRDVEITLKRLWNSVGFFAKVKLIGRLMGDFIFSLGLNTEKIEEMKKHDQVEILIKTFGDSMPEVKKVLIDERDDYIAEQIYWGPGEKVVAVVGAGHVKGIAKVLEEYHELYAPVKNHETEYEQLERI